MSIDYYERNADRFFADTVLADVGELQTRFVRELPPSGRVLDAGCGSGRDAKTFAGLGFDVTAFDASAEMVLRARQHTGLQILHMSFDQMAWNEGFDGVWASASLLHVSQAALPAAMKRCRNALRWGGIIYSSFKYGSGERSKDGRNFTDMNEATFTELLATVGDLAVIDLWRTADVRPGRQEEMWLNSLVRKAT